MGHPVLDNPGPPIVLSQPQIISYSGGGLLVEKPRPKCLGHTTSDSSPSVTATPHLKGVLTDTDTTASKARGTTLTVEIDTEEEIVTSH